MVKRDGARIVPQLRQDAGRLPALSLPRPARYRQTPYRSARLGRTWTRRAQGQGRVIISGHIGNWDMAGAVMVELRHDLARCVRDARAQEDGRPCERHPREGRHEDHQARNRLAQADVYRPQEERDRDHPASTSRSPTTACPCSSSARQPMCRAVPRPSPSRQARPFWWATACAGTGDKTFMGVVEPPIEYQSPAHRRQRTRHPDDHPADREPHGGRDPPLPRPVVHVPRDVAPHRRHDAEVRQKRFWGGKTHIEMAKG